MIMRTISYESGGKMDEKVFNREATAAVYRNIRGAAEAAYEEFLEESKTPMKNQNEFLMKLLKDNQDTEYGKKYGFAEIRSIEEYQKKVPVIIYDDIAESIERMLAGEKNILTAYPFDHMNETSGTVGNPKLIPMTQPQLDIYTKYNNLLLYGLLFKKLDPKWVNGRAFCTTSGNYRKMPSGITVGEASSKMADYIKGGKDAYDGLLRTMYTSPVEAVNPLKGTDTKYIATRFALEDRAVTGMIAGFYSVAVLFLQYIADHYELLINDIEHGTVSDEVDMPDEARESLLKKVKPMPQRAAELREIFKNGSDFPFVPKVWPDMCYLIGVGGDGFSIYDRTLKERFTGGCVKNIYAGITASEGAWSASFDVDNLDTALLTRSAFMEFLPVEAGNDFSKCVTLDRLEKDKVYELIVTTVNGFYRYRMSDSVIVTGFYNQTPLVQFMGRVNRTINLAEEKTTEKAIQVTVERTCEELGIPLSDFCVYPNDEVSPGYYVFLIEPYRVMHGITKETLEKCVYKHLLEANPVYADCVAEDWLKVPQAYFLQPQTAALYKDLMVAKGASMNQLKPVRVINNEFQRRFFYKLIDDFDA